MSGFSVALSALFIRGGIGDAQSILVLEIFERRLETLQSISDAILGSTENSGLLQRSSRRKAFRTENSSAKLRRI